MPQYDPNTTKTEMQVDGKWVAGLNRERDERENLLHPFLLALERGRVSESHQCRRRDGSKGHQLVEVDCTSDVQMTYK